MHLTAPPAAHGPRAPKLGFGKLHSITVHPASNGAVVTHRFHGVPNKKFVFHDPATMRAHITRALKSEWRHPDVDLAQRIGSTLNDE